MQEAPAWKLLLNHACPPLLCGYPGLVGGPANAGATLIASMTTISATADNNTRMRFFIRYPFP
jgi:hypothetical protein